MSNNRKAYGSITIYDLSDTDKLSVNIEYNHPRDIVWNHVSYNPDFSKNPLVLTPVIYLGSEQLGVDRLKSITWSKKDYNGNTSEINSGIDPATGVLTISDNILTEEQLAVTYICDIAYKDLTATNQVNFNLLIQPQPISSISITGDSVFLYDQNNQLKTPNTITLNAKIDDCEVIRWEYRNAQGNWVTIDGSDFKESIIVSESDPYYPDDVATIRVVTNITSVYDIHQIYKIRDGAAGADLLQAVLSNEYINIPCDKDGNVISLSTASIKVSCYLGNDDLLDSSDLLISINKENLQGNFSREGGEFIVTSLDADVGKAEFTFEYEGEKKITKTLRLNKVYAGQDGKDAEIYYLHLNSSVVNKDKDGNYTPNIIQATAYKNIGNKQEDYSGYIVFYDSFGNKIAGSLDTLAHVSDIDVSAIGNQKYEVKLFSSDDINKLLDSQTIVVVSDGDKGDVGDKGEDSVNFIVGNQFEGIPCDKNGKTTSNMRIEISYQAFRGTKSVPCTASIDIPSDSGFTLDTQTSKDSTNTQPGCIILRCNAGSDLNNSDKGDFNITLTTKEDTPVECTKFSFSWSKVKTGQDGATSPILTIVAPQGNVINNGENSVTLEAKLLDGVDEPTINTVSWYKFDSDSNEYVSLSNETSKKLIVGKDSINSSGLYKCSLKYKDETYEAYSQVIDKTDPIQVEIISTLGDKIFDYQATGYLYARVYRNGIELDPLQNIIFSDTQPENPEIGDVWFDIISNIARVYKGTNQGWQYFTKNAIKNFDWDFIPNNLTSVPTSYIGNFLFIDGSTSRNYNQIHLSVTLQSGIKGNSNFYIIDSTEGQHLGTFDSLDDLNSYIDLHNIVLRPNTKYYNSADKITYIWNSTNNTWETLVKDGEVGNNGKNADTPYNDPIELYAASDSKTTAPNYNSGVYSEEFPDYSSSMPYVWNITAQEWTIYDDDNTASFETRYSAPRLINQLDCVTKWATAANIDIGEWCSQNEVTIVEKGMIATGSVTADTIAANAITSDKMNVNSLAAISGNLGAIKTGSIQSENYKKVPVIWS